MGKKSYKHPRQYTTETFKKRLKEIYGDRFVLDFVEYNGAYEDIILACPVHGKFKVRACSAARGDASCKKCSALEKSIKNRIPFEKIIQRILEINPNLYIDKNQEYVNTHTKISIICPKHGEFKMTPNSLFNGQGCPKCGKESMKLKMSNNLEWLIKESNKIHGDKYSFEKFVFKNTKTKGIVTCKKHGDFKITPDKLIYCKHGCPICNSSHLENATRLSLERNKIKFIHRHTPNWLGKQHLDFFLPDYNIAIECQGIQHYEPVRFGGVNECQAKNNLIYVKSLDNKKKKLCHEHNVRLIYIKYDDDIESIINKLYKELLNKI